MNLKWFSMENDFTRISIVLAGVNILLTALFALFNAQEIRYEMLAVEVVAIMFLTVSLGLFCGIIGLARTFLEKKTPSIMPIAAIAINLLLVIVALVGPQLPL